MDAPQIRFDDGAAYEDFMGKWSRLVGDDFLAWLAPAPGKTAHGAKDTDWQTFATLADFQKATGQETHGVEIDFDIFENLAPPDPAQRYRVYHSMDLNFRLKAGSRAIDAGRLFAGYGRPRTTPSASHKRPEFRGALCARARPRVPLGR